MASGFKLRIEKLERDAGVARTARDREEEESCARVDSLLDELFIVMKPELAAEYQRIWKEASRRFFEEGESVSAAVHYLARFPMAVEVAQLLAIEVGRELEGNAHPHGGPFPRSVPREWVRQEVLDRWDDGGLAELEATQDHANN